MADPARRAPELRGLVLAGGRSERFGRDKAAVLVEGQPMLERVASVVGGVVGEVRIAVRADQLAEPLRHRFALVPDVAEGIGPAGGILAAHRLCPDGAWLVVACDMPRVTQEMLAMLIGHRDPARPATAFRTPADGLPEPLCAIYEPATLARFRRQVEAGGNASPRSWLVAEHPVLLDTPGPNALCSINTPGDLDRLSRP
jgi:molybdopterin-guanine dinucleotide biosynthesis protein A